MSIAINNYKPRHQQAAEWAGELHEHLHWMEPEERRAFLASTVELAVEYLSDFGLAAAIGDIQTAKAVLYELQMLEGEDDE